MAQILPTVCLPKNLRNSFSPYLVWCFLGLEMALLIISAVAGIKYVLLILIGTAALFVCFVGRLPAILVLVVITPIVFLGEVSPLAIRAGKWGFVIVLVLTWFLGKAIRGEKIFVPRTSVNYFVICFVSWGALISLYALDPMKSFINLLRILSIFGMFYLFVDVLKDRECIRKTVKVWIGMGIFVSLLGIYQYQTSMTRYGGQRIWATFENANALGIFLFLLLPLVLSLFFLNRAMIKKMSWVVILFLLLLCLFWTGSRSSWVASYVALVSFGFITRKRYITLPLIALGVVVGFALSYSLLKGELFSLLRVGRGLSFRPILWGIAWRMVQDHPLFGVGFGCMPLVFQGYYPVGALSLYKFLSPSAGNPHNLFLQVGAEMGILGILIVLGFFTAYFLEVRRRLRATRDEYHRALLMAFLATVPALFFHSFFERSAIVGAGSYTVFFWLSAALVLAIGRIEMDGTAPTEKKWLDPEGF